VKIPAIEYTHCTRQLCGFELKITEVKEQKRNEV
jgi:hypothetical protein